MLWELVFRLLRVVLNTFAIIPLCGDKIIMSYKDFETRKSVHINLTRETHSALKICAIKYRLSMQEIFEELARHVVEEHSYMVNMLNKLEEQKRTKAIKQLSRTDAESIFKVIENDNPLTDN